MTHQKQRGSLVNSKLIHMVIPKKKVIKNWLKTIGKNQTWLAVQMGYTKGYLSQVMNDDCKVSMPFAEKIMLISHMEFNDLFISDGKSDVREWYGEVHVFQGKVMNHREYQREIRSHEIANA